MDGQQSEGPESLLGRVVADRYRVDALLGEGSMGVVYQATHLLMERRVALKVLHPKLLDNSEAVERFQREAQAGANLEHPNICAATDFGRFDGERSYLVMELLDGVPLDEVVAHGALSARRAVGIAVQIARALRRAHEMEIIHRDIKPENVVLLEGPNGEDLVKLTDFGVARVRIGDADKLTQAGTTYGTPLYMSPEQARGGRIDHRTDLYSVGVVLFELLTGRVPFFGERVAIILSKQCHEAPPTMTEVAPELAIPEEVESIVGRLLEKAPEDRFQTAQELEAALHEVLGRLDGRGVGPAPAQVSAPAAEEASEPRFVDEEPLDPVALAHLPDGRTRLPRVKTPLVAGVAAVLILGGLAVMAAFHFSADDGEEVTQVDKPQPVSLSQERAARLAEDDVQAAVSALAAGEAAKAVSLLSPLTASSDDAHLHFLLGRAKLEAGSPDEAVVSFGQAVAKDGRYAEDEELVGLVVGMIESESEEVSDAGLAAAEGPLADALRPHLARLAEHGESRALRRRSYAALRSDGGFLRLERWQQISVRLRHTGECEAIRRLAVEAREVGDPRALPALRRNARLPTDGCGFFKNSDCYACMRDDLAEAIRVLEAASNPQAKAP